MNSSSGGLGATLGALVLLTVVACAVRIYLVADERVGRLVRLTVWFSWVLSGLSMLLLPLDLARQAPVQWSVSPFSCDMQPISLLSVVWGLLFWFSLVLGFAMVELLREYELTGCFHWKRGVRLALRRKAKYYTVCAIIFAGLVIGLAATNQLEMAALIGWLCAACNAWSAVFLMLCLAYALVELPRHLWRLAPPDAYVAHLQHQRWHRRREMVAALHEWSEVRRSLSLTAQWLEEHQAPLLRGRAQERPPSGTYSTQRVAEVAAAADEAEELEMLIGATPCKPAPIPGQRLIYGSASASPRPPPSTSPLSLLKTSKRPTCSISAKPEDTHGAQVDHVECDSEDESEGSGGSDERNEGSQSPLVHERHEQRWHEIAESPPPIRTPATDKSRLWSVRGRSGSMSGALGVAREQLLRDRLLNCARLVEWELNALGPPQQPQQRPARQRGVATMWESSVSSPASYSSPDKTGSAPDVEGGDVCTGSAPAADASGGTTGSKGSTSPGEPSHDGTSCSHATFVPEVDVFFSPWCCAPASYCPPNPSMPIMHGEPQPAHSTVGGKARADTLMSTSHHTQSARLSSAPSACHEEATQTDAIVDTEPTLSSLEGLRVRAHTARLAARSAVAEFERVDALVKWWEWAVPLARRPLDIFGHETTVRGLCTALYTRSFVLSLRPILRTAAAISLVLGAALAWSELCLLLQWLVRIGAFPWWKRGSGKTEDQDCDPLGMLLLGHALLSTAQSGGSPLLLLLPVFWMRFCIGWALAKMHHGALALRRDRKGNDSPMLLLDATNNLRLTLALCFNYVCLLQGTHDVDRHGEWSSHVSTPTAFYCLYEPKAQLSLLWRRSDDYYPPLCPLLLLLIGLFLGCNVYERVLGFLGFDTHERPEVEDPDGVSPSMSSSSPPAKSAIGFPRALSKRFEELKLPLLHGHYFAD